MSDDTKPLSYGSLRYERDLREHGEAVTTRPWWNAPGEESREVRFGNSISIPLSVSRKLGIWRDRP